MVFAPGQQEERAHVEPDNSSDMQHAWLTSTSDEPHWAIPHCTSAMPYSLPSTESGLYQWQNDYVWKFFNVPSGLPCTFHIYIATSPMSKYNPAYDWTNGRIVGDWVDQNAFTTNQAASADAPLPASEVRLTCTPNAELSINKPQVPLPPALCPATQRQ